MYIKLGKLKNLISIKRPLDFQNEYGEQTDDLTWSNSDLTWEQAEATWDNYLYKDVWASIEPLIGKEFYDAKKIQSEATVKIRIRFKSGIESNMQVEHGTKLYEIISIENPYIENKELILMCKEVTWLL